ncbi:MAG: heparan-alpha-glucosaminide N-acetyltransferase domain-containing protein [Candidatus Rokuibacteriota bacterium]
MTAEGTDAGVTAAGTRTPRRVFVDALRGLAVALMVLNHTARWWTAEGAGPGREALIYATMVLAGPTFLFLVGFALALARFDAMRRGAAAGEAVARNVARVAVILAAALFLNATAFPGEPVLTGRVLVSIAFAIVLALPALALLPSRAARLGLLVTAGLLYIAFRAALPALAVWSTAHPTAARIVLLEFPLLPWLGIVLVGLVLGWEDARRHHARARDRHYRRLALAGGVGVVAYLVLHAVVPTGPLLAFSSDVSVNGYWTAGARTAVGMLGAILCLLAGAYHLVEVRRWRVPPLVVLGRAALMVYVLHHLVALTLVHRGLGIVIADWRLYGVASAALLVVLAGAGAGWLRIKASLRRRRPPLVRRELPRAA